MIEPSEPIVAAIERTLFGQAGFKDSSIPLGIPEFDQKYYGIRRADLVVAASGSAQCNDHFLHKLIKSIGVGFGRKMSVFLLDTSTRCFVQNALCASFGTSIEHLVAAPEEREAVVRYFGKSHISVAESPRLSLSDLEEYLEQDKPEVVLISGTEKLIRNVNAYDEKLVVDLSRALKDLAEKYSCAIVIDAKLPNQNGAGDVSDLPCNGAIAIDADLVLSIEQPETTKDSYRLAVIKSVHGYSGTFDIEM